MHSPALVLRETRAHNGFVGWDGGTVPHAGGFLAASIAWNRLVDLDEYLAGIVERNEGAFARWISHAEPTLRASLRSFAATVDTEAVLQETLLRIWQTAPGVERDRKPNALLRYSFRIARNLAISEVRRTRSRPVETDDMERQLNAASGGEGPEPPDPLLRRVIALCRDKLPPKPRTALDLRLSSSGGQSDADLAAQLDMTKNTFLQNFTRARKLLAQCLSANGVRLEESAG
jgi:RNA polymerase sigma-70 factor (ECF subfamily)